MPHLQTYQPTLYCFLRYNRLLDVSGKGVIVIDEVLALMIKIHLRMCFLGLLSLTENEFECIQ